MKTIGGVVIGMLLSGLLASPAAADQFEVPGTWGLNGSRDGVTPKSTCISGYEFRNLKRGTPRVKAERFLDGPGRFESDHTRVYRSCAYTWRYANVGVTYYEGVVFDVIRVRTKNGTLIIPPRDD